MTSPTQSDVIRFDVVKMISINMMDFSFSDVSTNFTHIPTSNFRRFFKKTTSVFMVRVSVAFIKLCYAFFRAKFASTSFNRRLYCVKAFITKRTNTVVNGFSKFFTTFHRAKLYRGMFSSRLQIVKRLFTISTLSFFSRFHKSNISASFRAKAFFLVNGSRLLYFKGSRTNPTSEVNLIFLKGMLADSRTKNIFVFFKFIRKDIEDFITKATVGFHRLYDTERANNRPAKRVICRANGSAAITTRSIQ
jgi:hypothetical protein